MLEPEVYTSTAGTIIRIDYQKTDTVSYFFRIFDLDGRDLGVIINAAHLYWAHDTKPIDKGQGPFWSFDEALDARLHGLTPLPAHRKDT